MLTNIVWQLRQLPIFAGNVYAALSFAQMPSQTETGLPAAVVVPLDYDAEPNANLSGLQQSITARIGVHVIFPKAPTGTLTVDGRLGTIVAQQYEAVMFSLFRALLNWRPGPVENPSEPETADPTIGHAARGFYFLGAGLVSGEGFDLSRAVWRYDFGLDITVTDLDGWNATGVPLYQINFGLTDPTTGDVFVEGEVTTANRGISLTGVQAMAQVGTFEVST